MMEKADKFRSSTGFFILITLSVFFVAELVTMFLFADLLPRSNKLLYAISDAFLMIIISSPFMWWLVTNHKMAVDALRESEDKFRFVFEHSIIGKSFTLTSGEIYANNALCEMLGYSQEELHDHRWQDITHPDDIELTQKALDTILSGQKESARFTKRYLHKNGSFVWGDVNTSLRLDKEGKPLYFMTSVIDITERKRAEEALRESEDRYRSLVENVELGITLIDANHRIIMTNAHIGKMLRKPVSELVGRECFREFEKRDRVCSHCPGTQAMAKGLPTEVESEGVRDDSSHFPVQIRAFPIFDSNRAVTGFIEVVEDITERRKFEQMRIENERLAYASKAKSEFLANMSHELRTPLNAVIGFSELLQQKKVGELNEKQNYYANNIVTSGKFLLGLINDILDLSKIEAGKIELVIEKIPVPQTINETIILIKEKAMKNNVIIKTEFDAQLDSIEADRQRFKQIFFNLLSNAIKFSKKEGGTVSITAKKEEDIVKISVSDTGIGIKEEDMGRLFNEFEQLDSGISRKYGGTGLGLAISKKLVELHGGKIIVESKYDEGSTFILLLPQ